jgi:hypothetical protein
MQRCFVDHRSSAELDTRIARLETSSRRDRLIGFAVVALLFATAAAPAPSAGDAAVAPLVVTDATGASATLTGRGLTVRDPAGHVRSFVGIDAGNRPSLDLSDASGTLRESMYLLDDQPELRQFDSAGKRRLVLSLNKANDGQLLLNDANETLRLALFRASSGDPQMGLYGSDAKLRAYFSTDDTSPYLVMRDNSATNRIYIGGYSDGSIGMNIRNTANAVVWKVP